MTRTVFVAGATGFTGQALLAQPTSLTLRPHARPGSRSAPPPGAAVCELADPAALDAAMRGCQAVVQLIGTVRTRFAEGDSYESVDFGTTVALGEAARRVGVDHLVLLSSWGAGHPVGGYLAWKRRTEQWVEASGIPFTIVRPSFIVGPGRAPPPDAFRLLGALGLRGLGDDGRAIPAEVLARAMLRILERRAPLGAILTGRELWPLASAPVV